MIYPTLDTFYQFKRGSGICIQTPNLYLRPISMANRLNAKNKERLVDPLYGFDADRMKGIIEKIGLKEMDKDLMCYRWLVRVENMEKDARKSKLRHYAFKMTVIVGSAIVPVLASLNTPPSTNEASTYHTVIYLATLIVSMIVSISAGVHEFFRYGDRWRHYRGTVETLKSEGWHFIQQTGKYRNSGGHEKGYRRFAERVEGILSKERERYMTDIAKEKTNEGQGENKTAGDTPKEKN